MKNEKRMVPVDGLASKRDDDSEWLALQSPAALIAGFNKWLSDFCENPSGFERVELTAIRHAVEEAHGRPHDFGEEAFGLLRDYCEEAVEAASG